MRAKNENRPQEENAQQEVKTDAETVLQEAEKNIEEMNPEEEPLIDKIDGWKKQYKKVFMSSFSYGDFIWRRLRRTEYIDITNRRSGETVDEIIANRQSDIIHAVVLDPVGPELDQILEDYEGLLVSLSDEILDKSGFAIYNTQEL